MARLVGPSSHRNTHLVHLLGRRTVRHRPLATSCFQPEKMVCVDSLWKWCCVVRPRAAEHAACPLYGSLVAHVALERFGVQAEESKAAEPFLERLVPFLTSPDFTDFTLVSWLWLLL